MITLNNTNITSGAAIGAFLLMLIAYKLKYRNLNSNKFQKKWKKLEKHCASPKSWCQAIIDADNLLNEALKKKRYKGKNTGERLVSAQRQLSSNHTVWFGHKLRLKIDEKKLKKISKKDTKAALSGFYKALKDLGAIKPSNPKEAANE